MKLLYVTYCLLGLTTVTACNHNDEFSKEDRETQEAFIQLIHLTRNSVDKKTLIDSIKTLKLPGKQQAIRAYESGGYINKTIELSEEDRRIRFYHQVIELGRVGPKDCFLPAIDHNFSVEDFIFNIEYCIANSYPKIKTQLLSKFPETNTISDPLFAELNTLLQPHGVEMGIVQLYDDQFYFIFYDLENKDKVHAVFDRLGIQIGNHNTLFRGYKH